MTKRPLRKHEFEQIGDAQRPRLVAPARRSGLRERLEGVAAAGRSGSSFELRFVKRASDFRTSLQRGRSTR
ncbi:hypothetical protein IGI04_018816 [Brassica rapa subsp. trilocularis]|uniref:Uncharacterized protein n=1 Tax=Brassica rapa subsp. trilocularis TaxID=1813537 RepID=A0ABQ7MEG4_BRACM|nr:hypothetical protein IGI04_018816 [Brassica rapa subsp. trilocularis]